MGRVHGSPGGACVDNLLRRSDGVTLIEIIIALLVATFAMIPTASIMGYGGRATVKDARRIIAIQTLDKTMRQLLQEDYDVIPTGNGISTSFGIVTLGNITSQSGTEYIIILDSEYISPVHFAYQNVNVNLATFKTDEPEPGDFMAPETLTLNDCIKALKVTVRWNEQANIPVEVSAISYRADFARRNG